ncbi:hypothetical protein EON77_16050 [bacterium]|nr:MAG: hypothetical protein EON77_16050 [bacterium]
MKKNGLEWAVFAFGLIAILVVIVGLGRDIQTPASPPDLRVTTEPSRKIGSRWIVPVTVRNLGGEAAASVAVRATAGEQEAEFDLEYVPRESQRGGNLIFRDEPKDLKVDVAGAGRP